jgi:hypothetical protein
MNLLIKEKIIQNYGVHYTAQGIATIVPRGDGTNQGLVVVDVARHLSDAEQRNYVIASRLAEQQRNSSTPIGQYVRRSLVDLDHNVVTAHAVSGIGDRGSLNIQIADTPMGHSVRSVATAMNSNSTARQGEIGTLKPYKAGVTSDPVAIRSMEDGQIGNIARQAGVTTLESRPTGFIGFLGKLLGVPMVTRTTMIDLQATHSQAQQLRYGRDTYRAGQRASVLHTQAQRQLAAHPIAVSPAMQAEIHQVLNDDATDYVQQLGIVHQDLVTTPTATGFVVEDTGWQAQQMMQTIHEGWAESGYTPPEPCITTTVTPGPLSWLTGK